MESKSGMNWWLKGANVFTCFAFIFYSMCVGGVQKALAQSNSPHTLHTSPNHNQAIVPAVTHVVSGVVTDSVTHWPLYASIDITGDNSFTEETIWTDPVTGNYSVGLPEGTTFTFSVNAWVQGYDENDISPIGPLTTDLSENIALLADGTDCNAPGYTLSTTCQAPSGGLVVGNAYDANTLKAMAGVTVSNDGGYSTATAATDDPNVDDGFYTLYSPSGTHTFTASLSNSSYGNDTINNVVVGGGQTVKQDFYLPAPALTVSPSPLQTSLMIGNQAVVPLTLTNNGGVNATYQLQESNGGSSPAISAAKAQIIWLQRPTTGVQMQTKQGDIALVYPESYRWTTNASLPDKVLAFADDQYHKNPTFLEQALQNLGISYTFVYDNLSLFETDLTSQHWDEVLIQNDYSLLLSTTLPAINTWVQGGGHLGAEIWQIADPSHSSDPLFATLGVSYVSNIPKNAPIPATVWWVPGHPIFTTPTSAAAWPYVALCPLGSSCGTYDNPVSGVSTAIAGWTSTRMQGQANLIVRNDGQTVFKTFLDEANTNVDSNSNGIKDAVELWENIAYFLLYSDIPWLSEASTSGTVPANSSIQINVTFDSSTVQQSGLYTGTLKVLSNDPINPFIEEPVQMTVAGNRIYLPVILR